LKKSNKCSPQAQNSLTKVWPQTAMKWFAIVRAFISFFLKDITNTLVICCIIFINALVGLLQEYRAQQKMKALEKWDLRV
jgi:magnesium-transporting ATPase (P-type)